MELVCEGESLKHTLGDEPQTLTKSSSYGFSDIYEDPREGSLFVAKPKNYLRAQRGNFFLFFYFIFLLLFCSLSFFLSFYLSLVV